MEGRSTTVCNDLKRCWRRRGYQKLHGSGRRVKVSPKLKLCKVVSAPYKLLLQFRDTYVNTMLKLAGSRNFTYGYGGGYGGTLGGHGGEFGSPVKDRDGKRIMDMYKSLVIGQGFDPRDVGNVIGAGIVCER